MKKIALLLCVIMCLGVFISCKKESDDKCQVEPPPEIDVGLTYYLSENVFIANVLEYTEREEKKLFSKSKYDIYEVFLDLKLEVTEVFKGEYTPKQTVEITLEKHNVNDFLYPINEGETDLQYFFALDKTKEIADNDMINSYRVYIGNTVRMFKISKDGLIRANYEQQDPSSRIEQKNICTIPLSVEDMVQEMFFDVYRPITNYLKTKLDTNGVGVIDRAENIFIGEIQKNAPSSIHVDFLERGVIGDRVDGVEYEYDGRFFWLFKSKVKVLNVYKGDYKIGDIVESYILVDRDYGYAETNYMDEQLFIDGAGFYEDVPAA